MYKRQLSITATSGNLLILVAAAKVSGFLSVVDGVNTWTRLSSGPDNWNSNAWYAKNITGGNLTFEVQTVPNQGVIAAEVIEFSGASLTVPINQEADDFDGNGVSFPDYDSGNTAAASFANDYVVGLYAYTNSTVSIPSPTRTFNAPLALSLIHI